MISDQLSPTLVQRGRQSGSLKSSRELWLVLGGLTLLYAIAVWIDMRRFVWFDELLTFDVARASSFSQLLHMASGRFDTHTLPVYLQSRWSMAMFGANRFGLRLPSIVEFYAGSLAMFFYVRRKVGSWYAAIAVLLLWASSSFYYAIEARPYALLFMCFSFLLLSWDSATVQTKRTGALWGVAIASFGLLSSHGYAPLSLFPFLVAEGVRLYERRKPDYPLWAALLLPSVVMLTYIPLLINYRVLLVPFRYQASLRKGIEFYYNTFDSIVRFSFWIACAAGAAALLSRDIRAKLFSRSGLVTIALFGTLIFNPLLLNLLAMRRHGLFYDRYCIASEAAIYIAVAILLGWRFGRSRWVTTFVMALLLFMTVRHDILRVMQQPHPENAAFLANIRPDLPLVEGAGEAFLEMNHHESADFLKRVYYLRDREAAVRYEHTTYFEDYGALDEMKPFFRIPAPVESYERFVRDHREFVLFANERNWIVPKLRADGASLTPIPMQFPTPYSVSDELYLVKVPPNG